MLAMFLMHASVYLTSVSIMQCINSVCLVLFYNLYLVINLVNLIIYADNDNKIVVNGSSLYGTVQHSTVQYSLRAR